MNAGWAYGFRIWVWCICCKNVNLVFIYFKSLWQLHIHFVIYGINNTIFGISVSKMLHSQEYSDNFLQSLGLNEQPVNSVNLNPLYLKVPQNSVYCKKMWCLTVVHI